MVRRVLSHLKARAIPSLNSEQKISGSTSCDRTNIPKQYRKTYQRNSLPTILAKMCGTLCLLCRIPAIFAPSPLPPDAMLEVEFGPKNVCFHVKSWSMVEAVHSASVFPHNFGQDWSWNGCPSKPTLPQSGLKEQVVLNKLFDFIAIYLLRLGLLFALRSVSSQGHLLLTRECPWGEGDFPPRGKCSGLFLADIASGLVWGCSARREESLDRWKTVEFRNLWTLQQRARPLYCWLSFCLLWNLGSAREPLQSSQFQLIKVLM